MVELRGVIASEGQASADNVTSGLQAAFKDSNTVGVVLRINSPGGSVTASEVMWSELMRFRESTHKPVVACLMDHGCGGAYYLATGCDLIVAQPGTLGSAVHPDVGPGDGPSGRAEGDDLGPELA
jgi:protease-4